MRVNPRVLTALVAALLFFSTPTSLAAPVKARTYRVSPTGIFVTVEVRFPEKSPVSLKIEDGTLGRITVDGRTYGIVPLTNNSIDAIEVIVNEIRTIETGDESLSEIERIVCGPTQKSAAAKVPFQVRVLALAFAEPSAEPPAQRSGIEPNLPCENCCVTCQGMTSCACAVQTPCGSCCCGRCCKS